MTSMTPRISSPGGGTCPLAERRKRMTFKKILAGLLTTAMLLSAAGAAVPVLAEEDAPLSREELTLVLEDLVAELPELVPVALRLACAFNASGVRVIAIARSVTIRVLIKVFIRLIDIIFFGD